MKKFIWVSVLMAIGCRDRSEVLIPVAPNQLVGTWTTPSTRLLPGDRLTFTETYVYMAADSITSCQPVKQGEAVLWTYTTDNGTITLTFAGVVHPEMSLNQMKWTVRSFDPPHLVLTRSGQERLELEKCE